MWFNIIFASYDRFNRSDLTTPLWEALPLSNILGIDISANDKYMVIGTEKAVYGYIYLMELVNLNPLQVYQADRAFSDVSISAKGDYYLGTVPFEYTCHLFEKGKESPVWNFTAGSQIEEVEISDNGDFIGCGSYDNNSYLFNRQNIYASIDKEEMFSLKRFEANNCVYSVEISESGEYFAFTSRDNNIYMFHNDIETGVSNQPSISFGYFFLIFACIGIATVLLLKKDKIISKSNKK